jgi:hypothetical protein
LRIGGHEEADADAERTRLIDEGRQARAVGGEVPAVVGGGLPGGVGNEGALVRPRRADDGHQVVEGIALDVELGRGPVLEHRGEIVHVSAADVALVGPGVHGDAMSARFEDACGQAGDARDGKRALGCAAARSC